MEAHSFSGRLAGLDDGAHQLEGALLLEERTDGGSQLFLLARELELHRTPSPALPFACSDPAAGRAPGGRSGASVPDAVSASGALCYLHGAPFSGKYVDGCSPGGSPVRVSPGRRFRGIQSGSLRRCLRLQDTESDSPTLCGAPLAQRQSNGLLIRRFRVRIPRGALRKSSSEAC